MSLFLWPRILGWIHDTRCCFSRCRAFLWVRLLTAMSSATDAHAKWSQLASRKTGVRLFCLRSRHHHPKETADIRQWWQRAISCVDLSVWWVATISVQSTVFVWARSTYRSVNIAFAAPQNSIWQWQCSFHSEGFFKLFLRTQECKSAVHLCCFYACSWQVSAAFALSVWLPDPVTPEGRVDIHSGTEFSNSPCFQHQVIFGVLWSWKAVIKSIASFKPYEMIFSPAKWATPEASNWREDTWLFGQGDDVQRFLGKPRSGVMSECDAASTGSVLTFKSRDRALGGLWVPRAARWRKTWYLRQKNRTRQLPPFPAPIVSCAIACQLWHFRLRGWEKYLLRIEQTRKHDQMTEDTEAFSWAKIILDHPMTIFFWLFWSLTQFSAQTAANWRKWQNARKTHAKITQTTAKTRKIKTTWPKRPKRPKNQNDHFVLVVWWSRNVRFVTFSTLLQWQSSTKKPRFQEVEPCNGETRGFAIWHCSVNSTLARL